jgi:hypothetical protein
LKSIKTYHLINGFLEINNSKITIKYRKFKYGLEIFKFFAGVAFISSFIKKIENYKYINETYELVLFWFFGLASCILVYLVIHSIFKKIWTNTIDLNDLIKIEIYDYHENEEEPDKDSKIEITIIKNNGREKKIELKKENNQLKNFLSDIKEKNTRITIKHL